MSLRYLLAIDVGTTNTKAALFDLEGNIVRLSSRKHGVDSPKEGYAEHDAEKVWWKEVTEVCCEITGSGIEPDEIGAAAVSALSPALVPLDGLGRPLYPAMLYGLDRRAKAEILELKEKYRANYPDIIDQEVSHLSTGPKILWLKRNEPEVFEKTRWFVGTPSYVVYRLTGRMTADYACYNIGGIPFCQKKFCWDEEMCETLGIRLDQLPPLQYAGECAGRVTKEAAELTGLPEGLPVAVGTGDFPAECVGYGTVYGDRLKIGLGTTFSIIRSAHMGDPVFPDYDPSHPRRGKRGGATSNGCSTIDWIVGILSGAGRERLSDEELQKLYDASAPGANGLILLPYLNGEKSPFVDLNAKGLLYGLERRHTAADIYRAALEAAAFQIRHVIEADLCELEEAYIVGGGANIPGLLEVISGVLNIPLGVLNIRNASLVGGAFLAGQVAGIFRIREDLNSWIRVVRRIEPETKDRKIYLNKYGRFLKLYETNASFMSEA